MKPALMLFVVRILARQASAVPCISSGLIAPRIVTGTNDSNQLAYAVNCSGGYFFVDWIGEVTLAGVIEVGDNTTLEILGAEDGSSYINGSGHSGLFQTTGGTLHLYDLTLANGTSKIGGAISALFGVEVQLTNCTFVGNNATRGGAIFAKESTIYLLGYNLFDTNTAGKNGGGIHGARSSIFFEGNTVFKGNEAERIGGGVTVWGDESSVEVSGDVLFERNKASGAGGLRVAYSAELVVLGTMTFASNTAIFTGGGMSSVGSGSTNFSATSSVKFKNNTAFNGGAMGIEDSYVFIDGGVIMESNKATSAGGAVHCIGSEAVEVNNVVFSSNFASESGGAISMISVGSEHGVPTISNCSFKDNHARASGGAVHVAGGVVDINISAFTTNTAEQNGGAIAMDFTGSTETASTIRNCGFEDNMASDAGGAVYLAGGVVDVGNSTFTSNTAGHTGGAIRTSGIIYIDNCIFEENTAYEGTAVSTAITSEMELEAIHFENNKLLCRDGFFLDWSNGSDYDTACDNCGTCVNCSTGSTTQVQLCTATFDNTASPLPNGTLATLTLDKGYWRSSENSKNIIECYEPSACVGGSETYCEAGYSGPC